MATDLMAELVAKASKLPADKLRQVVTLVDELAADQSPPAGAREPKVLTMGKYAHLGPLPPTEVLNEWRREAWINHPTFRPDDRDEPADGSRGAS